MGETRAQPSVAGKGTAGPPGAPGEANPPAGLVQRAEISTVKDFFPTWIRGAGLAPRPEEGPGSTGLCRTFAVGHHLPTSTARPPHPALLGLSCWDRQ